MLDKKEVHVYAGWSSPGDHGIQGVIEVFYQGHPVWIEQIEQDTARIRMLDNNQQLNVPINMLAESE